MNFHQYKIEFTKIALDSGFSDANLQRCLNYAEPLVTNGLPVIYNTTHLAGLVGYKKKYLKRVAIPGRTPFFYREFEITKKNGKKRRISEPLPSLKEIQIWILKNILYEVEISRFAKAYVPKQNIKNSVSFHKKQKQVLTLDIENFFPSISRENVEDIFSSLGYSPILSNLFSKLCCLNEALPQGAPTSPCLSNIYMKPLDESVSKYCVENKIKYTRYADDLTFSGDFDSKKLIDFVLIEMEMLDLKINSKKTKLMLQNQKQEVTGIVVNDKPQVNKLKRNELRQTLYYIMKHGIDSHMVKMKIEKSNYLAHLLGQINFVLFINKEDKEFIKYKEHLENLKM